MIVHITINASWFVNKQVQCQDDEKHGGNVGLEIKRKEIRFSII